MKKSNKFLTAGVISGVALLGAAGGSLLNSLAANADSTAVSTGTALTAATSSTSPTAPPGGGSASSGPHTANGITETQLTGDTATKAIAAAQAAEPGATVIRAETDADGAKYEVHMQKSDGTAVTVKLDANFKVTATETGMGSGGPSGGTPAQSQG